MRRGETHEVTAERLDADGRGVARIGDRDVSVADLLPGERAAVVIEHVSPNKPQAWARVDARLGELAPERVVPVCPVFGRCGGCAWQHLAYPAQLAEKRRLVCNALGPVPVDDVVPAPREVAYRNLGKYVIGPDTLGGYAPRSHELVSTLGCAVVEPVIDEVARALAALIPQSGLTVYDERARRGDLRYAVVRSDGKHALVGLVCTSRAPAKRVARLAGDLRARVREVTGVVRVDNDSTGGALLGPRQTTLEGEPTVRERLGELSVEVGVGSFFQINRVQAARMYAAVADRAGAGPGVRIADVYCGVGGIALTMAARGARVVGIERDADAIATARAAAERNRLDVRFEVATAGQLGELVDGADVVVVNPPRKGLDADTRAALARLAAPRLIYVSCNPITLARDLAALADAGYAARSATPFDLMPGTAQVETIAVCERAG